MKVRSVSWLIAAIIEPSAPAAIEVSIGSTHPELVQALIDWRREKYQKDNVPAYIILHQKTLLAIADLAPTTREELLTVKGFGKSKCDKYGDEILEIIRTAKSQGSNE